MLKRHDKMNKGTRFYNCDFQVHTPRDINWSGPKPVADEDRNAYATRFVLACRQKGVNAVAITDHHDLVFFFHTLKQPHKMKFTIMATQ